MFSVNIISKKKDSPMDETEGDRLSFPGVITTKSM